MSFLGSIGHLMAASGLQEMMELIYASNAVVHMLTGKAVARAIRGHLLVDAALNALIAASTFDVPIPVCGETECEESTLKDVQVSITFDHLTPFVHMPLLNRGVYIHLCSVCFKNYPPGV